MQRIKKYFTNPSKLLKPSLLLAFLALYIAPILSQSEWEEKVKDERVECPHATFSMPGKKSCKNTSLKIPFIQEELPAMEYTVDGKTIATIASLPYGSHTWNGEYYIKQIAHGVLEEGSLTHWERSGTEQLPILLFSQKKNGEIESFGIVKAEDTLIQFSAKGEDSIERVKELTDTVLFTSAQHQR